MPSIFLFFGILSSLVLIHELGHFLAAKKVGVKVLEFGMGLPPRLFGKRYKGTLFSMNLLPFGGFVSLKGEDAEVEAEIKKSPDDNEEGDFRDIKKTSSDKFSDKNPYERAFVIVAGVVMNFLLAVVIFYGVLWYQGYKSSYFPMIFNFTPVAGTLEIRGGIISGFTEESKLPRNTFKSGDYIYSINGVNVNSLDEIRDVLNSSDSDKANLVVKNLRDTSFVRDLEVDLVEKDGNKFMGIYLTEAGRLSYSGIEQLFGGFIHSINVAKFTFGSLGELISMSLKYNSHEIVTDNVSGPVGIYRVVDSIATTSGSALSVEMFDLIALLSLSLAVMNILPIPAVDGGRLVFIVYEIISRRKPNPRFEMAVNKYGMLILLFLLIAITFKDVSQLINN